MDFVQADVYDAVSALGADRFDLVYTGVGALCWLPDIRRWARTVAGLLRPGGRLFIREAHPMMWTLPRTAADDLLVVEDPYFETPEPYVDEDDGPTSRRTRSSKTPRRTAGITGWARPSARCSRPAWSSPRWKSIAACRGRGCPVTWCATSMGVASEGATGAAAVDVYVAGAQDELAENRVMRDRG